MENLMFLEHFVKVLSEIVSFIGVIIIAFGSLRSVVKFFLLALGKKPVNINYIRLEYGYTIILGLEFLVGSDIIESMVKPDYYEVGILGLLVLIRTFLTYFLNKELSGLGSQAH